MKNTLQEGATSGSDGNFPEDALAKFGEWTFVPDSSMDSVFGHSDDLDSEGICFKWRFAMAHIYTGAMNTENSH